MRIAPVGGSSARFCSWVSPYLPAPCMYVWDGKIGSNPAAAPASVPTVSTPRPTTGDSSCQPPRAVNRDARGVRAVLVGVEEGVLPVRPGVPSGAIQQPATFRQLPVLTLPGADVLPLQQEVRVRRGLYGEVQHRRRPDQPPRRYGCDVLAALAADPVTRGVEMRAGVLAGAEVVPVPRRPALVIAADLLELELRRLAELRRKLEGRRAARQRRGEIDDLDRPGRERRGEFGKDRHGGSLGRSAHQTPDTALGDRVTRIRTWPDDVHFPNFG